MKPLVLSFVLFCVFVPSFGYEMLKDEVWLKNYFHELKKTYDRRVAPMGEKGPGSPVEVFISMYILDISEVDDSSMDYTAQLYFRQNWNDSRLRYTDRSEFIVLREEKEIWTPDLFFTRGREGRQEHIVHPNVFVRITPSGSVFYSIRITVKFSCPMDLRYFPHDVQKCDLMFESYAHGTKDIDIKWYEGVKPVGASKVSLHNFHLRDTYLSEKIENFTNNQYKVLSVNLIFQRNFGYFAIKIYVPFILLVIVSLLSLWIKPEERGIRLSLLVIVLYFMTNLASDVNNTIPPAPYTKGTDVWIGFCETLVFSVLLEFIAVALIAGRREKEIVASKSEILLNMESDSKEQSLKSDTLKSNLCKLVNMFEARNGGKVKKDNSAHRIDKVFKIVFPLIFIFFNVVYWSFYCCKPLESLIYNSEY